MSASIDAYRIFYHVATCGSFTVAAHILHNSQPNLTRIINQLESELDCRLFIRSNKGVALTSEGEVFYMHIREAMLHIECAENELKKHRSMQNGQITIATSEAALRSVLLPALQEYRQAYPGIQVNIHSMTTAGAVESLKQRLADFAVVTKPLTKEASLSVEELDRFRDILIVPRSMEVNAKEAVSLQQISDWPFISMHRNSVSHEMIQAFFAEEHLLFQPSTYVSSLSQIAPMVANGLGAAFVPEFMAREHLERGEIVEIALNRNPPSHAICVITSVDRQLNTACKAFLEKLHSLA